MDNIGFDRAIAAHSEWKRKLTEYIRKPDGSLKTSEVSADNKCTLGQWIYGDGAQFSNLPAYTQLKSDHAHFHKAAAQIITRIQSGERLTTEDVTGHQSEFSRIAARVVLAIGMMKKVKN